MNPPIELLIVAHGSPSDPAPQEDAMGALAFRVAALLPGARVGGATLAADGALAAALADLERPLVYPFFMAAGWFTGTRLPQRLAEAGRPDAQVLAPFGTDPALPALAVDATLSGAGAAGIDPGAATLLLAAHGSAVSRGSAQATSAVADAIAKAAHFARVVAGFVEEDPRLAEVAAAIEGPALCLPLFALTAGHVTGDVPDALDEAGFAGPLLPPIGAHPGVPALIAAAVRRASVASA